MITRATKTLLALLALLAAAALLSACTPVAAWERGTLAKPEMALTPDPLDAALHDHVYFSKEASSGGNSASGGGCGCN
ncbi:MAG TPA: DUF4266 domain-containing protein [Candidatus Acidoferrum sp.]|nr:DUF4266 domain-containing protein [Candidatus Acidoferrum sp.]